ncbi:MAG: carboxyl transferase domain-containing protein [Terricaulis sp.]
MNVEIVFLYGLEDHVAEDFTIFGGSASWLNLAKLGRMYELARKERVPFIMLQDGAGARAQEGDGEGIPTFKWFSEFRTLSGLVPVVSAVLGPCAGHSALMASGADMVVMTRGTSMLAAAGPRIVSQATGKKITKEELGGASVHCDISGTADIGAANDAEAIAAVRRYLSYLPQNAYAYPPIVSEFARPKRQVNDVYEIVPADSGAPYNMHDLMDTIIDGGSFFELKQAYSPMLLTGFATIEGQSIGIVASQPAVGAGALVADSLVKFRKFVDICDNFHVPLLFLVDVPGAVPAREEEERGVLRQSMAAAHLMAQVTTQMISVVVRKAYGVAGSVMCGGSSGQTVGLCWATADMSSLPPMSRTMVASHLAANLDEYRASTDPLRSTNSLSFDDVIEPAETRQRILAALKLGANRRTEAPVRKTRHGIMP